MVLEMKYCYWIWIGAIILLGIQIRGRSVVIGASTIVKKNIDEDYVLATGSPMSSIKEYDALLRDNFENTNGYQQSEDLCTWHSKFF